MLALNFDGVAIGSAAGNANGCGENSDLVWSSSQVQQFRFALGGISNRLGGKMQLIAGSEAGAPRGFQIFVTTCRWNGAICEWKSSGVAYSVSNKANGAKEREAAYATDRGWKFP